jgi:GAF domain-containing protein
MKRRSNATGKPPRSRRPKASKVKSRIPSKMASSRSSRSRAETEVARLRRELNEALEQQTATSKVLQIIGSSPGDLTPVFASMLEKAVRICDAKFGNLYRWDGDALHLMASHNTPSAFVAVRGRSTRPGPTTPAGRAIATKTFVHVPDIVTEPAYITRDPWTVSGVQVGGVRTLLVMPMLKEYELVGTLNIYRQEVRPFTDKQIELVQNFAAQAVIAIENARLLNELRERTTDLTARTADLTEALEQQTATSEVLQVISSSPGDVEPVFAAMLEKAVRICDALFGNLSLFNGAELHLVAMHNPPQAYEDTRLGNSVVSLDQSIAGPVAKTKQFNHVHDLATEEPYAGSILATVAGARTALAVPLLREGALIGVIAIYRQEVRPFTDKQIELLQNFAAQAVIAIENARLLNELRQRTTDLSVSLERQTATSEILSVISSSPGEIKPVFDTILANATRICEANFGILNSFDGTTFHNEAALGVTPAYADFLQRNPQRSDPRNTLGRVLVTKQPIQVADLTLEQAYLEREPTRIAVVEMGGARTLLCVPILKENVVIGSIVIFRTEVRPFTDKQIDLMQGFAAQAVIAIENARLLGELRERTDEVVKLNRQLELRVTDQVGEIERMSRLRRFLPPQVADLIVASGTEKQLESHRREITALFCDLRGFTGFSESADPEDVMALLRDYHAAIGEIIIKYSGTLERYAGDGVMVVFNDPVPVEKPALQAALMALEMREVIGALTEKWRRLGHDIGFGIGIAHGFATLGTIGFEGRFDYAAIGTVANVASRLCDEAKPGQILISPRVLMAVEDAVTFEPVGEFALKGIRRPLAAYNVLASKAVS